MKKLLIGVIIITQTSCATVFGGRISTCQKTPPPKGEHRRQVRPAAIIFDVLFFPIGILGLAIDFSDGAIYQPCK